MPRSDSRTVRHLAAASVALFIVGHWGPSVTRYTSWVAWWVVAIVVLLMVAALTNAAWAAVVPSAKASFGQGMAASTLMGMFTKQVELNYRLAAWVVGGVAAFVVVNLMWWWAWQIIEVTGIAIAIGLGTGWYFRRIGVRV